MLRNVQHLQATVLFQIFTNTRLIQDFHHFLENDDIIKLISSLNIKKTHVPDDISICTTNICDSALVKHLSLIFQNCPDCSTFPDIWGRKIKYLPCYKKKNDKQIIYNYRPVSLLPVFGKIFEKLNFLISYWVSRWTQIALRTSIWFQTKWFMRKSITVSYPRHIYGFRYWSYSWSSRCVSDMSKAFGMKD